MTYETVAAFTQSLSLLIFFTVFVGAAIYAVWPGNQREFDRASRLPLDSDETFDNSTPGTGGRS